MGERGCDAAGPDADYQLTPLTEYLRQANERTFVIIQIEEPSALEQAEAIAAVPGVDMLMLGPGDFSILSGVPGQMEHPSVLNALEKVASAARNTGKHWAATCASPEKIKEAVDKGASLTFHGNDQVYAKMGFDNLKRDIEELTGRVLCGRRDKTMRE